jgi:O-succinylbenzoate synthase
VIIRAVELRLVGVPLVRPFRTSFGETNRKECVLVRVETGSAEGWGECVADIEPDFSGEFNAGVHPRQPRAGSLPRRRRHLR